MGANSRYFLYDFKPLPWSDQGDVQESLGTIRTVVIAF
jgi:hypothetical protein